jgi:hypothetical protein
MAAMLLLCVLDALDLRIAEHQPVAPGYLDRFREDPFGSEEDRSLSEMLEWLSLAPEGCTIC